MKPFAIAVGDKKWRISNLMGVVKKKKQQYSCALNGEIFKRKKGRHRNKPPNLIANASDIVQIF